MNPLANFLPGKTIQNYWESDNQLATIGVFKELYESDKTKKKTTSSQIMWAVAFYCHPESRLAKFSEVEKKQLIESDIIGEKVMWENIEKYIKAYEKLYLTQAKRSLQNWNRKLEERDNYLNSMPYHELTLDDAKLLDALLANTPKLYTQYEDIMEKISDENAKSINKAGIQESAAEKGLL